MTFPKKYQSGVLRLLRPIKGHKPRQSPVVSEKLVKPAEPENEYFTFNRDGELIDLDDHEVLALERQVTDNWRQDFLANVEKENGQT
ncbi:MAG: hypothetical protein EA396_11740 [Anaerolineaceae bacterium]|nr:MAG: hypothetical protein EA396_11740 [Anaerolineaceae bacterium]